MSEKTETVTTISIARLSALIKKANVWIQEMRVRQPKVKGNQGKLKKYAMKMGLLSLASNTTFGIPQLFGGLAMGDNR